MGHAEKAARDCGQATTPGQVAERITVGLVPKAAASLRRLQERTSLSKTDITNRALALYDFIDAQAAAGAAVRIERPDGSTAEVMFL